MISLTTALPVGRDPAPCPYSTMSCTASPTTWMALYTPSTWATGEAVGSMVGWTRASTSPSRNLAIPSSFTVNPNSFAYSMSSGVIRVIPSVYTSLILTGVP